MRYRVWCDVTCLGKAKRYESKIVPAKNVTEAKEKTKAAWEAEGYEAVPVCVIRIADDGSENDKH